MSLFNPYILLGIVLAILGSFGGGYYSGKQNEYERQQAEIASLNAKARETEQALVQAVNKQTTQLLKVENNAKIQIAKRDAAISAGTLKLRIPVQTPVCPIHTATDAPPAPRDSVQTNAELDREVAKSLVAITDDGDKAIRQLNACIDAYNTVYETLNKLR